MVWVLSTVMFDSRGPISGGFVWFTPAATEADRLDAFQREREALKGCEPYRIRLVKVDDMPDGLDGADLTDFLDAERIDDIEVDLTSHRVAIGLAS